MYSFYIPKTKSQLLDILRQLGVKKPSILRKMERRQLYGIYFSVRQRLMGECSGEGGRAVL